MRDLTISDVAKRLGISHAKAKMLVLSGRMVGYKIPVGNLFPLFLPWGYTYRQIYLWFRSTN